VRLATATLEAPITLVASMQPEDDHAYTDIGTYRRQMFCKGSAKIKLRNSIEETTAGYIRHAANRK
jgi:hypothetical protein